MTSGVSSRFSQPQGDGPELARGIDGIGVAGALKVAGAIHQIAGQPVGAVPDGFCGFVSNGHASLPVLDSDKRGIASGGVKSTCKNEGELQ